MKHVVVLRAISRVQNSYVKMIKEDVMIKNV